MQKVVVIVNSGDRAIPRPLLEKLIEAAGADTWECIDLPTESRLTQRAADGACACRKWDKSFIGFDCKQCGQMIRPAGNA